MSDINVTPSPQAIFSQWEHRVEAEATPSAIQEDELVTVEEDGAEVHTPIAFDMPEAVELDSDLEGLPMSLRLLAQLEKIIPLLLKLEQGQNQLKREELDLLGKLLNDEIFKNNVIGCINLFGGGLAAVGGIVGGEAVAKVLSSLVQGVGTFEESGKIRAQKEFQVEQMNHQEIKELRQWLQQLQHKLEEGTTRAQQLMFLRA